MKYQNQRPDLADQIKTLVQSANSVKTVPHGVKTVNPGEGLQLLSGDGAEIFWDWETAAEYDTRISEGRAAIDQARLDLDQAEADLAAAAARLDENERILDALGPRVDAAESTVTQAAQDLNALETSFGDVQAKAEASEQKANDALAKSGAAQASAAGKNRITRATTPATEPGTAVGDTHFTMPSMDGGGVVTRQQRWDGSTWQDESVGHQVLASLDLGKATVGELDGIRVKARTLSSDRFTVGVAGNLIIDPNFNDPVVSAQRLGGRWQYTTDGGEKCFTAISDGIFTNMTLSGDGSTNPNIPVSSGTTYALTVDMVGSLQVYLKIRYANGSVQTPASSLQSSGTISPRRKITFVMTPDAYVHATADGTLPVGVQVFLRQPASAPIGSTTTVYNAKFAPRTGTVLIEDGAVTGDKVEASTVSGAIGQFLKVEAQSGTFTDSLTGRNARLLGETVAESINITGKLRGRDAILSGTVDVGQLNVTGAMSAEIVKAMDIQARRGIFTEGLTAAEATLLGTTVAENLNAGTVASRIMTSGLLQTTTAANRGVKIDNNGIRAWDSSGRQTVQINGTSNYITGSFSTAETGQRVRIRNASTVAGIDFFASNNTDDHLGIWYDSPDSNVLNAVAKIQAMTSVQNTRENPALFMWPMRGTFGFQGRWGQDTDATKFVVLTNFAGLGPGAYNTITINYQSAFPTNNSLRCPFVSVESATGADVMATAVQQTESNIRINIINQSGGKSSGTIVLRVVTFNINA